MSTSTLPDLRTREAIHGYLHGLALQLGKDLADPWVAHELDQKDKLAGFREKFHVPKISEFLEEDERAKDVDVSQDCIYFSGNSLGLQPKGTRELIDQELDKWAKKGAQIYLTGKYALAYIEDHLKEECARIIGAKILEVTVMNALSVNIHLGLVPFYQPTAERYKILMEARPFPSDYYAVQSQVRWHGYDPNTTIVFADHRKGDDIWHTEDIVKQIEEEGDSIALVFFSGVHFATGHFFDISAITEAAHKKGCYVGFDLAHAAGNVELHLHDWDVDFACWCTYKYMNSSPGGIAGFFVHEKHAHNSDLPRLIGWWSESVENRIKMEAGLELLPGAAGFQVSGPSMLQCIALLSSLNVFKETSMSELCQKSRILTGYLELLLEENLGKRQALKRKTNQDGSAEYVEVITSSDPTQRGCQLSLRFSCSGKDVTHFLKQRGVMCDFREPDIMRVAPAPLYNSFSDVLRFYQLLKLALEQVEDKQQ